jgi:glycosyltransferase involved in cell wall biosynthesis
VRVLIVHQPVDGGVGRHLRDLCAGLAERGHQVLTCGPEPIAGSRAEHVVLDLRRAVDPLGDVSAVASLARLVRRVKPDIVHAHSSKAGAVARLARPAFPRVPLLYTPHGYAFAGYFPRRLERVAYREAERVLAPMASLVSCVCRAEARLAESIGSTRRVRVVHNGVAIPAAGPGDPALEALRASGPVISTVTLLRPGKGVETLIDAVPRVLGRHPGAHFVIAGSGEDSKRLQQRAQLAGVGEAVRFLGRVQDPSALLRSSDIFVLPSWAESFPYAVLEAMASGTPVLATRVGGLVEMIDDGRHGLLVDAGSATALAGGLCVLLDDPGIGRAMAEAARARVEREFTLQRMLDGVLSVYAEA